MAASSSHAPPPEAKWVHKYVKDTCDQALRLLSLGQAGGAAFMEALEIAISHACAGSSSGACQRSAKSI